MSKFNSRNNVLIVGCGRLGASIANRYSESGINVIAVDKDEDAFDRLDQLFAGDRQVGDATNISFLTNACRIESATRVFLVSGNDNVNLFLAHVCSKVFSIPRIYVRFDDPDRSELVKDLPGVIAISPFQLTLEKLTALEKEDEQ